MLQSGSVEQESELTQEEDDGVEERNEKKTK
jgi:hypothetical protein